MRFALAASLSAALASCAWYSPNVAPAIVDCSSTQQCDLLWQRMQVAISEVGPYRIRLANDSVIETFGPGREGFGYKALRIMNPDGTGRISVRAYCNATVYGCASDPGIPTRAFAEALKSAQ